MPKYDPDPEYMGGQATLTCVGCGRSRYDEVVARDTEDVTIVGVGPLLELPGAGCSCGETKIMTGWDMSNYDSGYDRSYDDDAPAPLDETMAAPNVAEPPAVAPPPKLTSQYRDAYWETPTEPLPEPLAHQFRHSGGGQQCEADFEKMTLSIVRTDPLFMSEEPVLYDLRQGADGQLKMRPTEESRKVMAANIIERLAERRRSRSGGDDRPDRAKLNAIQQGYWFGVPPRFADAINERYGAFLRRET